VTVPVFTAITDAVWEADLVSAFERRDFGVVVVRRCVDLADLLAAAAGGTAQAVLLSADLRRFDRDAVARLDASGVAIVALVAPTIATGTVGVDGSDDPSGDAERRLRQLGVTNIVASDAGPEVISAAVASALSATSNRGPAPHRLGYTEPRGALTNLDAATAAAAVAVRPPASARGRVIAVWGPTGAPGRTTLAVSLAAEIARLGVQTLLIDADCYGGVVAQVLGLLDEAPGLAAAVRQANAGTLESTTLARLAASVSRNLRVLTGISRSDRWPELKPSGVVAVLELARRLTPVIVVDCGFGLEQDEELSYDTAAPRRNGSTLAVLEDADVILAVGSADPIGLQRLVRGLADLADVVPGCQPRVIVNRVRKGAVHGDPAEQIRAALARHAGVQRALLIPYDRGGLDEAIASGRTLAEAAPDSPVRKALSPLAIELADLPLAGRRRRTSRRIA
jgi:MinD-like ATPase involved in chromosome partitioning or flagellar assembly